MSHPAVTGAIFAMLLMAASFQALAADPPPAPPQDNSNCVSVQVDGVKNYDCANAKMQGEVGGEPDGGRLTIIEGGGGWCVGRKAVSTLRSAGAVQGVGRWPGVG